MSYYDHGAEIGEGGIVNCGAWVTGAGTRFGPHTRHDTHALFWITDGSAVVRAADDEVELVPNSVFRAAPGIEYVIDWDQRRATRFGYINFSDPDADELPVVRRLQPDDVVMSLLNHIVWLSSEKPEGWVRSVVLAFEYAKHAFRSGHSRTRVALDGAYSELVTRTLAAVQRRWLGPTMTTPSLDELASELGVNPRHLCRAFDSEIGFGPITVLRTVRVLRATQLLTETTRSIREISEIVGFANQYHFGRVFKATTGVPPGEYRFQPPERTLIPPQVAQLAPYLL